MLAGSGKLDGARGALAALRLVEPLDIGGGVFSRSRELTGAAVGEARPEFLGMQRAPLSLCFPQRLRIFESPPPRPLSRT